jgi:2-polyprenyl-3-methyl-5-hydroxy-6-metoxy-1,4-benzoquinol methylase
VIGKTVSAYPKGFVADLRRLRPWPSLRDSLWRNPDLVRLTYCELARLVQACVGLRPSRILYVGPGLGHIALELARGGHDVTGVDIDEESVALAKRAAEKDPYREKRGALSYEVSEFPKEFTGSGPYDKVVFSRVLHHIDGPSAAVAKAAELLGPGGSVVCVDFAHDRLGVAGARWVARSRMWLSRSGWWTGSVAGSLQEETDRTAHEWRTDHEGEELNTFRAMLDPLQTTFLLQPPSWHPYLFWDLATDMRVPADQEEMVARRMRDEEADLIRERRIRGVLFSTTGSPRAGAGR